MKQCGVGSIVALAGDGPPLRLLTDADLRSKIIAEGLNLDTPVERVMRTPCAPWTLTPMPLTASIRSRLEDCARKVLC